jgi:hypothetical protein
MLLGYPLDFKDATTLVEVCTPFARVLHWNSEDTSMSRVLLKVLVEDRREIPRDVVIKMGRESDGEGRSWTVPIYIFNSEILPDGPSDEEDPPDNNGDPHPFNGPVLTGEPLHVAAVADQYMEEILQQNPYPVVAVPDQGSSLVPLSRNFEGRSVVVTLDPQICRARRLNKQPPTQSLSQLTIPGSCKIKAFFKADGKNSDCSVVLPGGFELSVVVPEVIQKAFIAVGNMPIEVEPTENSLTLIEMSTLVKPIWTDRNKKITRAYFRRNKTPRTLPAPSNPVFEAPESLMDTENSKIPRKRKAIPLVSQELRRSKRTMSANKGFKPPSMSDTKAKKKGRPTPRHLATLRGKNQPFVFSSEFPDLAKIDMMISKGVHHPQIAISQLQKVGQEICGLLPSEVAEDKLLQPEDLVASEGGGCFASSDQWIVELLEIWMAGIA